MKNNTVAPFVKGIVAGFVEGLKLNWHGVITMFKEAPIFAVSYYVVYAALLGYAVKVGMDNSWWLAAGLYIVGGTVLNLVSFIRMRMIFNRIVNFN